MRSCACLAASARPCRQPPGIEVSAKFPPPGMLHLLGLGIDENSPALRELMANTSLAQHIIYQISPRAVVIEAAAVEALAEEMVAKGYTPGIQ